MAVQSDFSEKEWHMLVYAPTFAVNGIALIDGKIDKQETLVMIEVLKASEETYADSEMICAVAAGMPALAREMLIPGELRYVETLGEAMRAFQRIARIVDKKASADEAKAYKQFLLDVVVRVAESSGRSLGVIGNAVADTEAEFIKMMKVALGLAKR